MLEEMNDNLPETNNEADGKVEAVIQEMQDADVEPTISEEVTIVADTGTVENDLSDEAPIVENVAEIVADEPVEVAEEVVEEVIEAIAEVPEEVEAIQEETTKTIVTEIEMPTEEATEEVVVEAEMASNDSIPAEETPQEDVAVAAILDVNAAESEDETLRHDIPMQDYDTLSMDELVAELETLTSSEKVMAVKDHVEELKNAFLSKYHHFIDDKKEEFHAENPDTTEDFNYHFPLKTKFDQLYNQYRDRKSKHFKRENCIVYILGHFWKKIGLLLCSTSGHTAKHPILR